MSLFRDRHHAGRELATALARFRGRGDVIVLALPRGGVPIAYEVADALGAPLDVLVVRKLGVPGRRELAMGAIASGGLVVIDQGVVDALGLSAEDIAEEEQSESHELIRREHAYRANRAPLSIEDKTVILVDDGLATGATMRAAIRAVRKAAPLRIVAAVPVAAASACAAIVEEADDVVCAQAPEPFHSVGQWYEDFTQLSDDEVRELLDDARRDRGRKPPPAGPRDVLT